MRGWSCAENTHGQQMIKLTNPLAESAQHFTLCGRGEGVNGLKAREALGALLSPEGRHNTTQLLLMSCCGLHFSDFLRYSVYVCPSVQQGESCQRKNCILSYAMCLFETPTLTLYLLPKDSMSATVILGNRVRQYSDLRKPNGKTISGGDFGLRAIKRR